MTPAEIDELRRRLHEAEETLKAIRQGDVDALVVGASDDTDVYMIGGDPDICRSFLDMMEIGAAAIDNTGRVLYANAVLADLLGRPLPELEGMRLAELTGDPALEREILAGTLRRRRIPLGPEGAERQVMLSCGKLRLGTVSGHAVTFTDFTEQLAAERSRQNEKAALAIIACANEPVFVCDTLGRITHLSGAAAALAGSEAIGRPLSAVMELSVGDGTGLLTLGEIVAQAIEGLPVQGIEAVAAEGTPFYLISAAPLQVPGEAVSGCVITMVDLSQRKAAERHQQLLLRELDHRVKNTLALVMSISRRTMHSEDTLEGYQKAFTARIQALAATHNLLAAKSWSDISIRDVLVRELAPYNEGFSQRILVEVPEVEIEPRSAIALGLVIHELATNATKYGSLSTPEGQVRVCGIPCADDLAGVVCLEWLERGGPPVSEPTRTGFGQTVIRHAFAYAEGGGAEVSFEPDGLRCRVSVPTGV
ncbi:HWE histidine kinase domain-containing protein [Cereibacter johrii]|uniref:HWE histidine kinase domain-containing protein n=1 Tax=Cereibacter johrii TaxID=445629 RepID=UPI000C6D41F8|nr:HWE histidine kinase domain-containing protein [Cereibacter johrii]MEA5162797.1 HWE histidine kinase domain-containing protein [Cereibacter johrii]RAZ82499.1 PAS domain-containing protein [Cereibacter johrii]RDS96611.1 PAS domain-containing protein [Cereibacter sphaeroides f. sp. denitrificans]